MTDEELKRYKKTYINLKSYRKRFGGDVISFEEYVELRQHYGSLNSPTVKRVREIARNRQEIKQSIEDRWDDIVDEIRGGIKPYWLSVDYNLPYDICRSLITRIGREEPYLYNENLLLGRCDPFTESDTDSYLDYSKDYT